MESAEIYQRQFALTAARQDLGDKAQVQVVVLRAQEYLTFLLDIRAASDSPIARVVPIRQLELSEN